MAKKISNLCLATRMEGVVRHVNAHEVSISFKVGIDTLEKAYDVSEFIEGEVPKKGDNFILFMSGITDKFIPESDISLLSKKKKK